MSCDGIPSYIWWQFCVLSNDYLVDLQIERIPHNGFKLYFLASMPQAFQRGANPLKISFCFSPVLSLHEASLYRVKLHAGYLE